MPSTPDQNKYAASLQEARQQKTEEVANRDNEAATDDGGAPPKKKQREPKINMVPALFMGGLAAVFDLVSLLPIANIIASVIATLTFGIWLILLGFRWSNEEDKTIWRAFMGSNIIEFLPMISILPAWIAFVTTVYIIDHYMEKLGKMAPGGEEAIKAINKV
jgi:hypothetical protein